VETEGAFSNYDASCLDYIVSVVDKWNVGMGHWYSDPENGKLGEERVVVPLCPQGMAWPGIGTASHIINP